jgi:hypothetical protein
VRCSARAENKGFAMPTPMGIIGLEEAMKRSQQQQKQQKQSKIWAYQKLKRYGESKS